VTGTVKVNDEEFARLIRTLGNSGTARYLNADLRNVRRRRRRIEQTMPSLVHSQVHGTHGQVDRGLYPERNKIEVRNGTVIVASDFHLWPGQNPPALRALKMLVKELKPAVLVANGDVLDFPQISRHPPMGWENLPSPVEEIECAQHHLHELVEAAPAHCRKIWTLGNHDARFEMRLAAQAKEYKGIKGIHLHDHFPLWERGWSVWINDDVVCKHRWKGGVHATHNNTVSSGVTMITGHLHSAKVTPFTDYTGTRYGVDTGCIADQRSQAFGYTEDNPLNWRQAFGVLTFVEGKLLMPELCQVWDEDHVQFRGSILGV
jgi:hypothetical protein